MQAIQNQAPVLQLIQLSLSDLKALIREAFQEHHQSQKNTNMEGVLTLEEARTYFDISKSTLWDWRRKGILSTINIGKKIYIRRAEIEDLLEKRGEDGML
jgi:predicted DNA-binding transcriptional regulator AlpA